MVIIDSTTYNPNFHNEMRLSGKFPITVMFSNNKEIVHTASFIIGNVNV